MKPNQESESELKLDRALRQWTLDTPLPPRFQEQVWQRISRAETKPKASFWDDLARVVEVVLPRPKIALSYVAALLVFGVAAGSVAAQIRTSHLETALSARYVHAVNPYQAGSTYP